MDTSKRDPALDSADAEFDPRAFGGDVDGPGMVSSPPGGSQTGKGISLRAEPPETKNLTKNGALVLVGVFAAIAAGIVLGVGGLGQDRIREPAQTSHPPATVAGAAQAPKIGAEAVAAGGSRDEGPEAKRGSSSSEQQDGRLSGPSGQVAPAGPSHREQYEDWLERHRYDRLRAQHMAFDQAHKAPLVGDSVSRNQPAPRLQAAVAAAPAQSPAQGGSGMGMSGEYVGQPRPERISPEILSQLTQGQGRAQGSQVGFAGFQPQGFAGLAPQGQSRSAQMEAFAESSRDVGYLNQSVREARPGHEVAAGSIIPAVMLSGINSDLPGSIVAQVRSDVFSTFDFQTLLIPAGSRLIGRYQSDIATGQQRVLVAWDELIFPNGRRISLEGMGAVDGQGAAGMRDQVNTHFWRIWGNALMISAIGVAVQQSQPQNANQNNSPTSSQQAAAAAANSLNETAQQVLRRNLNISPTLEIRPGYTFSVMVNRSISLPAYRDD